MIWSEKRQGEIEMPETCYVAAVFDKAENGYDMRTVGDRFFHDDDCILVAKHALAFLQAVFDKEKEDAEDEA